MSEQKWGFYPNDEDRQGMAVEVSRLPDGRLHNTVVRDVTIATKTPRLFQVSVSQGEREEAWAKNTLLNMGDITHSILALRPKFQGRDIYIVGSGISATKYGPILEDVTNGVILAVNHGIQHVPNPYRDNVYFGCMDWLGSHDWLKGLNIEAMKAILCSITARAVWSEHGAFGRHWKEPYWFANQCSLAANHELKKLNKNLPLLDAGFSIIYSLLHGLWLLQPRSIIFLGVEGAYSDGFQYSNKAAEWKTGHPWTVGKDVNGRPIISDIIYQKTRDLIVGMCYFLRLRGIRIINVAQCGTLSQELPLPITLTLPNRKQVVKEVKTDVFEQRRLVDVIMELETSPVAPLPKEPGPFPVITPLPYAQTSISQAQGYISNNYIQG